MYSSKYTLPSTKQLMHSTRALHTLIGPTACIHQPTHAIYLESTYVPDARVLECLTLGTRACLSMPTTQEVAFFPSFSSCLASLLLIGVRVLPLLQPSPTLPALPLMPPLSPLPADESPGEAPPAKLVAALMPTLPRLPARMIGTSSSQKDYEL